MFFFLLFRYHTFIAFIIGNLQFRTSFRRTPLRLFLSVLHSWSNLIDWIRISLVCLVSLIGFSYILFIQCMDWKHFSEHVMWFISQPEPHLIKKTREALLRHLTSVLGNDDLAAHFMLLHLLSQVCRSQMNIPLSHFMPM